MHIPDGLANSTEGFAVLAVGGAVAAAGTAIGLRKMDYERMPQVALLSAAFFVASLVRVPIGVTSMHLVLNGLVGLVLGWAAFPAILIGLLLQAVFFGFGGLTTLGINTATMALPAVVCYYLCHGSVRSATRLVALGGGFVAGLIGLLLGAVLTAVALAAAGKEFAVFSPAVVLAHVPLALVEGAVTASAVAFLRKVHPELLHTPLLEPGP
ncbi:MAG: cobalt transporter CbiM [Thermoguttaceae bacterium]